MDLIEVRKERALTGLLICLALGAGLAVTAPVLQPAPVVEQERPPMTDDLQAIMLAQALQERTQNRRVYHFTP